MTVERNSNQEDSIQLNKPETTFKIKTSRSEERLLDKETTSNSIPEHEILEDKKRERSLSFFNFSVFKRTISDTSDWKQKAQKARQKKIEKSKRNENIPKSKPVKKDQTTITRSRSLTEIDWWVAFFPYCHMILLQRSLGYVMFSLLHVCLPVFSSVL